jgi:drug/metabolite transporter (DMT)-like permease
LAPGALILPLGAGFGYACGAIAIKRALGAGISAGWVNFFCNATLALFFQVFWLFSGAALTPWTSLAPMMCGVLFFLGQVATFQAIASGDVSVATPLLGVKVILVALFSVFLIGHTLPSSWWLASLLASIGIALISYSPGSRHKHLLATISWSLGAASLFALTDVLVQRGVPAVGYNRFAPMMFGMTGICSCLHLPGLLRGRICGRGTSLQAGERFVFPSGFTWLAAGALLLSLQALGMYSAIGFYGSASLTNILYGSRCLWSVLLVWLLGMSAAETTSQGNNSFVMVWRLLGALLLFGAMTLVLR